MSKSFRWIVSALGRKEGQVETAEQIGPRWPTWIKAGLIEEVADKTTTNRATTKAQGGPEE